MRNISSAASTPVSTYAAMVCVKPFTPDARRAATAFAFAKFAAPAARGSFRAERRTQA